jgi:uncharacterized membrane protein (DUF485 family)
MTGHTEGTNWEAIERSAEFRELVASRRRFVLIAGGGTVGLCAAYVVLAYLAPAGLGTALGWAAGVALIVLTWVVSFMYLRRSDSEWDPMEQRVVAEAREASGRFTRSAEREQVR